MVKKRTPLKHFKSGEDFQTFIDTEQSWMYERIIEAIHDAHSSSKNCANILEAKIQESDSVIMMKSEKIDWKTTLDLAIEWYVSQENYEKCAEIVKLEKQIFINS